MPQAVDWPSPLNAAPLSLWVQHEESLERLGAILLQVQHQRMADLLQPLLLPLADLIYGRRGEEEGNREWMGVGVEGWGWREYSLVAGWVGCCMGTAVLNTRSMSSDVKEGCTNGMMG